MELKNNKTGLFSKVCYKRQKNIMELLQSAKFCTVARFDVKKKSLTAMTILLFAQMENY